MEALPRTYEWAVAAGVDALAASLRQFDAPLVAVGSGGSFTAAHFVAFLHSLFTGRLARPMTPYELASSPVHLGDLGVFFLSAGGSNPDVLGCFDVAAQRIPKHLGLLSTRPGSPLAELAASVADASIHEFDLPTSKDGFLATNSLFATAVLLVRAYQQGLPNQAKLPECYEDLVHPGEQKEEFLSELESRCSPLWEKSTLVVLYGQASQAAAIDLESKFTEAALGHIQLADYRNFAHGRHHWLARHVDDCAVLSLASTEDASLAKRTLSLLPEQIPVAQFEIGSGVVASLKAVVLSLLIAGLAGRARGIDPGKPNVSAFGRRLYHLNGSYRRRADHGVAPAEATAIARKAGSGISTLAAQGTLTPWREAYATFAERLRATEFRAIVLDYDGTVCDTAERYHGPRAEVSDQLVAFLCEGILVGIATGRGKSVRKDMSNRIRDPGLMSRVIVGYHNGAEIGLLDDDTQPPRGDLDASLGPIADALMVDRRLLDLARIEAMNCQVTLEYRKLSAGQQVWDIVQRVIARSGPPGVTALRSSHSVDILAPGVTKSNVVRHVENAAGLAPSSGRVLCIGDRGRWPGNDFALLQEPCSLSVDEVSSDPTTCWNLATTKSRCTGALLEYFRRMRVARGVLRLTP
jgi:fructoselysine-6-P-deglycase FrlB-like protein